MWDFFEQPWTLLGVAIIVLLVVLTIRSVWWEKRRAWQWLLPLGVAALAFGLDALVATDLEKINAVAKTGIQAAEQEDCATIAGLLSRDYQDSYHKSKDAIVTRCRAQLAAPAIAKVRRIASKVKVTPPRAIVEMSLQMQFEKDSFWARSYKPSALVELEFHLQKQPDDNWLVHRIEVRKVDMMEVTWRATGM